jgi:hypothetical protein
MAPPTASDRPRVEQVLALSQRRISATLTWLFGNIKPLILFNFLPLPHRRITGLVSFCCRLRDHKKRPGCQPGPLFQQLSLLPISLPSRSPGTCRHAGRATGRRS